LNTGHSTRINHNGTNSAHAENFIRLATAPEIRAGVITANIPRKATVAIAPPLSSRMPMPFRKAASRLPMNSASKGFWASV
jgi:hypothetical protein